MKIILINWETGEVLEKGVLSKEHTDIEWYETYVVINNEFTKQGIKKVWMLAPEKKD